MKNSKKLELIKKIASSRAIKINESAFQAFDCYKKAITIIDRTNNALGRKVTFKTGESSATNLKYKIEENGRISVSN